jgi:hypothetical protein
MGAKTEPVRQESPPSNRATRVPVLELIVRGVVDLEECVDVEAVQVDDLYVR